MANIAVAGGGFGAASQWGARWINAIKHTYAAEGERRLLWLPVCFGSGIGLYFALPFEPPLWIGFSAALTAGAAAFAFTKRPLLCEAALAVTMLAAGFAVIGETAWQRQAPALERHLGPVTVSGRVVDIDEVERGWRVIVAPDPLPELPADAQPARLRIHVAASSDRLAPGDRVEMRAALYPVPGQIMPGAHDLQREAYFARIGGVGYSYGPAHRVAAADVSGSFGQWLRRLRTEMSRRITAVLPGSTGGVASALITGKRGAVSEPIKEAFRQSGLQHLLAIAGLHLGLVGGFVFFTVRAGLALIPWLALRYPIKKIAAAAALVVLACYLLLSGAAIPTQRAFVMNGLVFAAILIDRLRISMRICALAAALVLMLEPESLVGVSFQMSFGAVVALIAVYETFGSRLGLLLHGPSWPSRALGYAGAVMLTTVVVTLATDPFSIYHFHRVALYSPLANVVAVPLSAVWTLPWGVVTCLLMPFGLERLALVPMGWGIDLTIFVAQAVAALPGNVWPIPRLPATGLVLVAFGGLWLCLWQQKWRIWGVAAIVAGLAGMAFSRPPDIVIADLGRFLAVRAPDGSYWTTAGHGEQLEASFLSEEVGRPVLRWPAGDVPGVLDCAGERCRYTANGRNVALLTGYSALPADCRGVDAIVSQVPAGFRCRRIIPVVDRIDVWRQGAFALWLDRAGVRIESADGERGERPWVPQHRPHRRH
jgi:competence protein ComEC